MNFQLVSLNGRYEQSTTNPENASHKLMKSSQRNILFSEVLEESIYLYKTKQKLTQQFINIW